MRVFFILGGCFVLAAAGFLLTGCAGPSPIPGAKHELGMKRLEPKAYPQFQDDLYYDGLLRAADQSMAYFRKLPSDREFRFGRQTFGADHLLKSARVFRDFIRRRPTIAELNGMISDRFLVYRSEGTPPGGRVLFTGYYEPILDGSLSRQPGFSHPLYGRPDDLISIDLSDFSPRFAGERIVGRLEGNTVVPYYDRREMNRLKNAMPGSRPLAWIKDPVALFFLEIQGSGKIRLTDGTLLDVYYDGSNGRPYRSIGALLIDSGKIPRSEMSMQAIRDYLRAHPDELDDVLNHNPSRVFFRIGTGGPYGSIGATLTPGRSLATDGDLFPRGALAYVDTQKPLLDSTGSIHAWKPMMRFVFNQDTGGAIRGAGRADLFWGNGEYAETAAGHMKQFGALYFLVLKPNGKDRPAGGILDTPDENQ